MGSPAQKNLIVMVGPCGSGKSTMARKYAAEGYVHINQDSQGRGHLALFETAVKSGQNIIVDRMGFTKQQRERYIAPAKLVGYFVEIIILHESYETCLDRMQKRQDHETIKDEKSARSALDMFFSKYERAQDSEADKVTRIWPSGEKYAAVICDLDGTLCNVDHRIHHVNPKVKPEGFRKNWPGFFAGIPNDPVNEWCRDLLIGMNHLNMIVYCSGRDENQRKMTVEWLKKNQLFELWDDTFAVFREVPLYMRHRNDSRQDCIAKEIILDFEILTRYKPIFFIDDRSQVVDMWRKRGYTCLQCAPGAF